MKIITNNQWRDFFYLWDLPEKYQKTALADYDHLDEHESWDNWIIYKDRLYHLSDFMMTRPNVWGGYPELYNKGWDGCLSETFFSCVVIALSDSNEQYKIGLALDRKSTRLNSSHSQQSRMPSSA